MRKPTDYKTRFGLYKATIRAIDVLATTKKVWWLHQALYHCEHQFPDLLPQLKDLIGKPATLDDLAQLNKVNN